MPPNTSLASVENMRNQRLEELAGRLRAACVGPSNMLQDAVLSALSDATRHADLLRNDQRAGCEDRYARHTLFTDPSGRFTVVSIVWSPGQFSPVHGHFTWCGYVVVAGNLREELYTWDPCRKVAAVASIRDRNVGSVSFSYAGLEEVHRLGNSNSEQAVSIHVYGVDGPRVGSHVNRLVMPI